LFANLAIQTGISPRELMRLSPRMLWTLQRALEARAQESNRRGRGRR